jgi:hypothetical protein
MTNGEAEATPSHFVCGAGRVVGRGTASGSGVVQCRKPEMAYIRSISRC